MHHLLLVTLSLTAGATSLDARSSAYTKLLEDDSFCCQAGCFGAPRCDWFVIGGRWSGMLKEQLLGQEYRDALRHEFPDFADVWFATSLIEKHRHGLDQLWRRFGGSDRHPITRSSYDDLGADDDALLIDAALYESFLKEYQGLENDGYFHFADLDGDPVDNSWFIGRKWLVVVDYHY